MQKFLFIVVCSFLCACNNKTETAPKSVAEDATNTIQKNIIVADKYAGKLDELLTLEMAAAATGLPAKEAKKSPSTDIEKKINKFSITYSWKNDAKVRTIMVMKQSVTTPIDDEVTLSWVKNTTLDVFKQQNKQPTAAETEQIKNAIKEKTTSMENEGKASKEQATLATEIAQKAMENYTVEEVSNVGEYGVFTNTKFAGVPIRELKVYYNGLSFQLKVDVSNDQKVNDAKAITLAQNIINEKLK